MKSASALVSTMSMGKSEEKKISTNDFKGIMVPVFTCFKNDGSLSLNTDCIDQYAKWLKAQKITGVIVHTFTGEGPALGIMERMRNTEVWWAVANKYDLKLVVQIGGAPLPNVLELAEHAENLGVHAVVCLPELFYRPSTLEQLVGYCKIVSQKCKTRPFIYYHIPIFTQLFFDMPEFCLLAEESIPNFLGIYFTDNDLDMGARCLYPGRVVIFGRGSLLASAAVSGFESFAMTILNIRPEIGWNIYNAITKNDVATAKRLQEQVNRDVFKRTTYGLRLGFVALMKRWFNEELNAGFSAGPARKFV